VPLVAAVMGKVPGTFFYGCAYCLLAGLVFQSSQQRTLVPLAISTFTDAKDENQMPNIDVATPVSSAPSDRLTLGVSWVRPGVAGIVPSSPATYCCSGCAQCFEGSEE
jgi:hypothetical protein